jgi:soluble lytic murein transglycosylase-like protein
MKSAMKAVMKRRNRRSGPANHRRRNRRRRLHSALFAGASLLFVPHAGKPASSSRSSASRSVPVTAQIPELPMIPSVIVETVYHLPPEILFESLVQEAAEYHGVDPDLVRAVVRTESAFDPTAVSTAGAQGLMQLMPALSDELGVKDPFDPRENIFAGVRYLRALLDQHDGDEALALASYNAGPGAVERYNGVPPYPETEQYIRNINGLLSRELRVASTREPAG